MSRIFDEYLRATQPDPDVDTEPRDKLRQILTELDQGKYLGRGGVDCALADVKAEVDRAIGADQPTFIEPNHHLPFNDIRNGFRHELRTALGLTEENDTGAAKLLGQLPGAPTRPKGGDAPA